MRRAVRATQATPLPKGLPLAAAFGHAAAHYWLDIFPRVRRIPDPELRSLTLEAQRNETAKAEGAGAFAILAPRTSRAMLVRAQVAFATLFDYLDALAEQPSDDPIAGNRQLHQAMLVALRQDAPHIDYYARQRSKDDGGYLRELVEGWGGAFGALRSYQTAAPLARDLAEQIVRYQSLNLSERNGGHAHLADWARSESPPDSKLYWWEHAAGSSYVLGMLALMAAAAQPSLTADEVAATCAAYTLWVEAVITLLDSAVDEAEDAAAGQRSLVSYYASPEEAATRLRMIATEAVRALSALPNASRHLVIFAGLLGNYLTPPPPTPMGRAISAPVLETVGSLAKPTALVFRISRAAKRLTVSSLRDDAGPRELLAGAIASHRTTAAKDGASRGKAQFRRASNEG